MGGWRAGKIERGVKDERLEAGRYPANTTMGRRFGRGAQLIGGKRGHPGAHARWRSLAL